jgi:hypothetical protein
MLPQHSYEPDVGLSSCTLDVALVIKRMGENGRDTLSGSVRTSLAASILAGLSRFGVSEDRREMTLMSYDTRDKPFC